MKLIRSTNGVVLLSGIIYFLLHLPFINIPVNANVPTYLDNAIKVYENNFNPFIVGVTSYKPPLLFIVTAFLFKLFGPSRQVATFFIFVLSTISLYIVYYVGKKIFSERTALIATLLLCFSPLFIHQSFLFQDPIPAISLLLLCTYGYLSNKRILYFVTCSLLVLYKEPFILFPIYTYLFDIYTRKKVTFSQLFFVAPLVFFFLWMLINKFVFGWYVTPENISFFNFTPSIIVTRTEKIFTDTNFWFYFPLLFLIVQLFIHSNKSVPSSVKNQVLYFFGFIVIFSIFFIFFGALSRYLLPIFPFMFLIISVFITIYFHRFSVTKVLLFFLILPYITLYITISTKPIDGWGEDDLYRYTTLNKKTLSVLNQISNKKIIINWPWGYLIKPIYGFSLHTSQIIGKYEWNCDDYSRPQIDSIKYAFKDNANDDNVIFIYIDRLSSFAGCSNQPNPKRLIAHISYSFLFSNSYIDIYEIIK